LSSLLLASGGDQNNPNYTGERGIFNRCAH